MVCNMWRQKQNICNVNIKNDHSKHLKVAICGDRTHFACPPLDLKQLLGKIYIFVFSFVMK